MTERNNLFKKHPKTQFIAAHFGWHANDLAGGEACSTTLPNVTAKSAPILYDLGRQPRAARDSSEVPGPDPVRQGHVRAERVPVLLARVRDRRTNTSTTTATITPSGSCTAWTCRTRS